tara:strand:+ start:743 stop:1870 length:1128 start_codon:yes stop_codon:yes gene_type:complete
MSNIDPNTETIEGNRNPLDAPGTDEEDFSFGFGRFDTSTMVGRGGGFNRLGSEKVVEKIETLEDARLDWAVHSAPAGFNSGKKLGWLPFPDSFATFRVSPEVIPLGLVGKKYRVVQNAEVFSGMQSIFGGKAEIVTAGSLYNGRKIWFLAKLGEGQRSINGDIHEHYLLATSSHDGTSKVVFMLVSVRVVCGNSLVYALRSGTSVLAFPHTQNSGWKMGNVSKFYDGVFGDIDAEVLIGEELASKGCSYENAYEWAAGWLEAKSTRSQNMARNIALQFKRGAGNNGENRYDLLQGVTDHFTHFGKDKEQIGMSRAERTRIFISSTFDTGAKKKTDAMERLQDDDQFEKMVAVGREINRVYLDSEKAESPNLISLV